MLFCAGVVVQDSEAGCALLQLVKIILRCLHRLVEPEDIAGQSVEFLNFIQADELKCRSAEPDYFQSVIDATEWQQAQIYEDGLEVVPDG